jgi:hypothetical protein
MTIKTLSPVTQEVVGSLLRYLGASFPEGTLEEGFESVETDAVFLAIDRDEEGPLYAGVAGPLVSHARRDALAEMAQRLDLAAALRRAPEGQRVWMVANGQEGPALRLAPRDDRSPDHGHSQHAV